MANNPFEDKLNLMKAYGLSRSGLDLSQVALYLKLTYEEFAELIGAANGVYRTLENIGDFEALTDDEKNAVAGELVAARNDLAKEAADLIVVTIGLIVSIGLSPQSVWDLVHASNMSKLGDDGQPVKREDGKILKGPNYKPPNMEEAEPMSSLLGRIE